MMQDGRSSTAGFTLLEVLVALVILGFIVTGLAQGSRLGLAAWDRQARAIDHDATLDSTSRTLRSLIESMLPGGGPLQPAIAGDAHTLVMTAPMPAAAPIDPVRLADIALGVDAHHQLVLRWVPHLHARVLSPPPSRSDVLIGGVAGIDFSYFGASAAMPGQAGWVTQWSDVNPPSLIRVHIRFVTGQTWPDLIVAPMRRFDDE